ncbi:hypothetical protein ACFV4G_33965 [Kitasatospora sp. NPDC059747]|uniref:hypothetical protein n=1 Tax=Kitasatospora sp. NPDC059747 TaxID=3346930 RepID=UPI00365723BF
MDIFTPHGGQLVFDRRSRRTGVYMDTVGGQRYLRPAAGGCEWTADPIDVRPVPPDLEYADPAGAPRQTDS